MIEKTIYDYLDRKLSTDVHMQRPEDPATEYVLIEKTGSSKENHISRATMAFQSCAGTLYAAATLNETVKAAIESMPGELAEIGSVQLNSDYNYSDTASKQYRYQAIYVITHY